MSWMFVDSNFNSNISKWNVSNVKNIESMFANSTFNQDLTTWKPMKLTNDRNMSIESQCETPYWYSENVSEIKNKQKNYELMQQLDSKLNNNLKVNDTNIKKVKL